MSKPFNVRVYGIVFNPEQEILITDELIKGFKMTKFPGGGLEFGEGTIDCLTREFKEELEIDVKIKDHFYTTDFYQQSAFNKTEQILSIYYLVEFKEQPKVEFKLTKHAFDGEKDQILFRWKKLELLEPKDFSFPIDKYVLKLLKQQNDKY